MVKRSAQEEKWNVATHFAGACLSAVGVLAMGFVVWGKFDHVAGLACMVYAMLLTLMYLMSTASHWYQDAKYMARFRALDQAFIYLLIVGTYTPFSLHFWNAVSANTLLILMWAIAVSGFIGKVFFAHRVSRVSVLSYVVLGWMPVVGLPFHVHWNVPCMLWVLAGGIVYSLGTIFLINDQKGSWCHPVWHVFVIIASMIHYVAVMKFVAVDL